MKALMAMLVVWPILAQPPATPAPATTPAAGYNPRASAGHNANGNACDNYDRCTCSVHQQQQCGFTSSIHGTGAHRLDRPRLSLEHRRRGQPGYVSQHHQSWLGAEVVWVRTSR